MNDSVFYIPGRIEVLLGQIQTEVTSSRALALTDNHDTRYHLASYFISLGRELFTDSKFVRFWLKYRLSNIRPKIIRRGEFGLSRVIFRIAGRDNARVLNSPELLAKNFDYVNPDLLLANSLASYLDTANSLTLDKPLHDSSLTEVLAADKVANLLTQGAPAHSMLKVFLKHGIPIVKLDIFYRGIASISDLNQIARDYISDTHARDEFLKAVMARGLGARDLRGLPRLWHSFGLV